jgi:GNAT superfamily N-acetyltransferase
MTPPSPSPITVRKASFPDNVLLSTIGAETFLHAFGPDNIPEDMDVYLRQSFSPAIQSAELADPSSQFLIAEVVGEPVGYARLRHGAPPARLTGSAPVELVRLYARASWIGRNVGTALMEACLAEAVANGHDLIWLGVWEKNARAIAFYKKWGFTDIGSHPFRLGNDIQTDLLMARALRPTGNNRGATSSPGT